MLSFTDPVVTVDEADAYIEARAYPGWTGNDAVKEAAILRGQTYVASVYNSRWLNAFDADDVPDALKYAVVEAARRELTAPGSLSPDLKRGGMIKSVGAGSARVEYMDGAPGSTLFPVIDGLLVGLVRASGVANFAITRA